MEGLGQREEGKGYQSAARLAAPPGSLSCGRGKEEPPCARFGWALVCPIRRRFRDVGPWAQRLSGDSRAFPSPPQLMGGGSLQTSEAVSAAYCDKTMNSEVIFRTVLAIPNSTSPFPMPVTRDGPSSSCCKPLHHSGTCGVSL